MNANIIEILIPKETVSDDNYKIIDLLFKNGDTVKSQDIIAEFETSKATFEIESPTDGYVYFFYSKGQNIHVNGILGIISINDKLSDAELEAYAKKYDIQKSNESTERGSINQKISKPALKLIEENKIPLEVFSSLSLISTNDVTEYLKSTSNRKTKKEIKSPQSSIENNIILVGGGKHTMACLDILKQNFMFNIAGIVYTKVLPENPLYSCESLGTLKDLKSIFNNKAKNAILAFGGLDDMKERQEVFNLLKDIGFHLPNLIHPKSIVEPSVILGNGIQIFGGANIGSGAVIGDNCIINSNSVVSHHCEIGENVHITPGAILGGSVIVGDNSIIGMGTTLFYGIEIGSNVIINNGKHIFKNVTSNTIIK